jgi:hypothetical protein
MAWAHSRAILTGIAIALSAGAATAAGEPVALIMDVMGDTSPALEPFAEFGDGDTVDLGKDGEVTFAHYGKCENVVVQGGRLTMDANGYVVTGGKVVDVSAAPCPSDVKITGSGEIGGVVMRGVKIGGLKMGERPSFQLGGDNRTAYTSVRVAKDDKTLFEGPIVNQRFVWPFGFEPLSPATGYELHLLRADGGEKVVKFEVVQDPPAAEAVVAVE